MKKLLILFSALLPVITYSSTYFNKLDIKKTGNKKEFNLELLKLKKSLERYVKRGHNKFTPVIIGETGYILWNKAPTLNELASLCQPEEKNFEKPSDCQIASSEIIRNTDLPIDNTEGAGNKDFTVDEVNAQRYSIDLKDAKVYSSFQKSINNTLDKYNTEKINLFYKLNIPLQINLNHLT